MLSGLTFTEFDAAVRVFKARPDGDSFALLRAVAGALVATPRNLAEGPAWTAVQLSPTVLQSIPSDFQEIRAAFDRELTAEELARASGCIGYALRIHMAGEELSEPEVVSPAGAPTVAIYFYDSTKAQRTEPDIIEALTVAVGFMATGTPIRTSNRAGAGTCGTRLVGGIGSVGVTFALR
jgi:hypothetical protein